MTSSPPPSETESELVAQINNINLEQTSKFIEAVKKTHVPYETLQITETKLAESEAKNDFLLDKVDALKRRMYGMRARYLQSRGLRPRSPAPPPPPTESGFHKRASAERDAILALPDTSSVFYYFPARKLHVSTPSLKALCSKGHWLHDDVLDTFCCIMAMAVRLQVGMGHTVTINSSSASELYNLSDVGNKAEVSPLIMKLARSGFSWEYTRYFFFPLRAPGQDQWLLVWVDMGSKLVTIYNSFPSYAPDYETIAINTIHLLNQHRGLTIGTELPAEDWKTAYITKYNDMDKNNSGVCTCILASSLALRRGLGDWNEEGFNAQTSREYILATLMICCKKGNHEAEKNKTGLV